MHGASPFKTISVIGGGAWGTALASLAARNGVATLIWAREAEVADAINGQNENAVFLPGVRLPSGLKATNSIEVASRAEAFLMVAPAQHCRGMLSALKAAAPATAPIALCAKGIEQSTGLMLTDVMSEVWPRARPAVLSGPSFAKDVAAGLPTAVTLAASDADLGAKWIATVSAPHFRPYLSDDLVGAELGGAVKNVLAIAAGAVEGRGLGDSARAAVIARGFAEFQRLGVALGAKRETMAGLSGLGDLILTATSQQSRNMSLGMELGRGVSITEALKGKKTVAEGAATAPAVVALAQKSGVDMPICSAVASLVSGKKSIEAIIAELLARPLKQEGE